MIPHCSFSCEAFRDDFDGEAGDPKKLEKWMHEHLPVDAVGGSDEEEEPGEKAEADHPGLGQESGEEDAKAEWEEENDEQDADKEDPGKSKEDLEAGVQVFLFHLDWDLS